MSTERKTSELSIGIDLGTSTTEVAIVDSTGNVQVLSNLDGDLVTPSIVSIADDIPTVGKVAKQDKYLHPDKVAEQYKKEMGTVTENGDPIPIITSDDGTEYTPVQLSAYTLRYIKESAEKLIGKPISKAVISVPAYFKRKGRAATKDAGRIAGFDEVQIVDEPTAAATYYGLAKGKDQNIVVLDFGGGTTDVCILQVKAKGEITPIAVEGDPECGGSNVDEAIFQQVRDYVEKHGGELHPDTDLAEWMEGLDNSKMAKEMLARKDNTIIPLKINNKRLSMDITYDQVKEWSSDVVNRIRKCCQRALENSGLNPSQINSVVLVGGSSRLRFVADIVEEVFDQKPVTDTDPDMAVAKGDAILAAAHFSETDSPLIVEGKIHRTSAVKASQIAGRDLCAAMVTKKEQGDLNEYNFPIIPSGAKLPYEAIELFSPVNSQQTSVHVKLIDGPPKELSNNFIPLQEAMLSIKPTSEEENDDRIEFKISMDEEGMVDIHVRDKKLNKPIPVKFKYHTSLSESQIEEERRQLKKMHHST